MLFYPYFWLRPLFGLANLRTDATHTHRNVLFIGYMLCETTTLYVNKVCGRITRLSSRSNLISVPLSALDLAVALDSASFRWFLQSSYNYTKRFKSHIDSSSKHYLGNTELKHEAERFHVATPLSVWVSQSCPKKSKLLCEAKTWQNLSPYHLPS